MPLISFREGVVMVDGKTYSVSIIGCGRFGQHYDTAYSSYPDTEVVAIAEYNADRRRVVGGDSE